MARIGIYGGSFNPPHKGHILAAEEFCRKLALDKLLLIPAAIPPHKELPQGSPCAEVRLELLRLAAAELPFAEIDTRELDREGVSYTVDTLRTLREEYPDDSLYLCMGTDMLESFADWRCPEQIAQMATVVMAHRADDDTKALKELAGRFETRFGYRPVMLENDFVQISSTHVRRLLILGGAEAFVDRAVLDRIKELGLYGVKKDRTELPFEELKRESLSLHKEKRVPHVIGCSETAKELAYLHGAEDREKMLR